MTWDRTKSGRWDPASLGFDAEELDLSSDVTLGNEVKAIEVVAAGDLVVTTLQDNAVTVTDAPVGYQPPFHVKAVKSTANGTTATVIKVIG